MGNNFINRNAAPDSALACFTIVANRHDDKSTSADRETGARGYIGKWYVYFFSFFDYYKAYESLCHAEELSRGYDDGMVRVLLNFGCMYQTLSEQTKDTKTRHLPLSADNPIRTFNHQFYSGKLLMSEGRYADALRYFDTVISHTDEGLRLVRYRCVAFIYKSDAEIALHDYRSAAASLRTALDLSQRHNLKDAILEIYDKLSNCYSLMGDKESSLTFRGQYLQLKDALLNYQQLMKVNEMRFVSSMKKVDEQMQQVRHHQQIERIMSIAVFVIALVIAVFLWIVWHKNRRLSRQSVHLYERTVEMINAEEEEQRRRKSLEEELDKYKRQDGQRKGEIPVQQPRRSRQEPAQRADSCRHGEQPRNLLARLHRRAVGQDGGVEI